MSTDASNTTGAQAAADGVPREQSFAAGAGLFVLRMMIASIFIFSGIVKLGYVPGWGDPRGFATAVYEFKILHFDLIPLATFAIPWMEVFAGVLLVFGLMSRGAARILATLIVIFGLAMVTVLARGMDINCSCFGGKLAETFPTIGEYLEPAVVTWFSVLRNVVFLVLILPLAKWGAGVLALDNVLARK